MVSKMNICDLCQLSSPSGCTKLSNEVCLKDALKLIKATATNGDIIKAVFSNALYQDGILTVDGQKYVCMNNGIESICDFDKSWWDSPYKGGKE